MELSVEIGRTHMTVGEALELHRARSELERFAGEPADLLVNGSPIARGEVVVTDEQFGLRVTEILDGSQDLAAGPSTVASEQPAHPAAGPEGRRRRPGRLTEVAVSRGSEPAVGQQDVAPRSPDARLLPPTKFTAEIRRRLAHGARTRSAEASRRVALELS